TKRCGCRRLSASWSSLRASRTAPFLGWREGEGGHQAVTRHCPAVATKGALPIMWARLKTIFGGKEGSAAGPDFPADVPTNRHFVVELVRRCGHRRVAEVGVWKGHLSRMLLSECDLDHLLLVDPLQLGRNLFVPRTRGAHPSMMAPGTYNCTMGEPTLSQNELDKVHAGLVAELERDHPGRTTFLRLPSLEAAALVPDRSLDLVFI